jgi:cobalt/nickel transport system permease protein
MALCLTVVFAPPCLAQNRWQGVDDTVMEKVARESGRPPKPSLLPLLQGDLELFAFLLAGAIGGFVAGYSFRALFPPSKPTADHHAPPQ